MSTTTPKERVQKFLARHTFDSIREVTPDEIIAAIGSDGMPFLIEEAKSNVEYPLGAQAALAISGDPRAASVLGALLENAVSRHQDGLADDLVRLLAKVQRPDAVQALLHILRDQHLNDKKRREYYRMGSLSSVVHCLGYLGAPEALPRLAHVAHVSPDLAAWAIEAIAKIMRVSSRGCTPDQLRAVLTLPQGVVDRDIVRKFDPATDEWPDYHDVSVDVDCTHLKSIAAAELKRRGIQ